MTGAWRLLESAARRPGWEMRRVGDLVELTNGFPFDSDKFGPEGTLPLVRIRDLFLAEFGTYVSGPVPDQVVLRDGDIVIGMDGDFELTLWRRGPAALNQRMCLLRPREGVDARFVAYALPRHLRVANDLTYATTVKHLSSFDILSERILCPSRDLQRAIADYLDAEVARIDAMNDQRRAQAALISAHLRAAVDGVLDGLGPWLPLRRVLAAERDSLIAGPFGSQLAGDDLREVGIAGVVDQEVIIGGSFDHPKHFIDEAKLGELRRFEVRPADVLVSGRGTIGRVAIVPPEAGPGIIHPSVLRVRPDGRRLSPEFLATCLRWSTRIADYLRLENTATTIDVIYSGTLRGAPVPVPSLAEQDRVLKRIAAMVQDAKEIEQAMRSQMNLLLERRQALITAAVSGQLDIPGIAA